MRIAVLVSTTAASAFVAVAPTTTTAHRDAASLPLSLLCFVFFHLETTTMYFFKHLPGTETTAVYFLKHLPRYGNNNNVLL